MKTVLRIIGRIGIILLAAGIVCGGVYFWTHSAGSSTNFEGGDNHGGMEFTQGERPQPPAGFEGGRSHELGGGGEVGGFQSRNLIDLGEKLGIVAGITLAVFLVQTIWKMVTRFRKRSLPPAAPTTV